MKLFNKAIAVLCVASLLVGALGSFAYAASDVDYKINNPYSDVNWSTVSQYKADLHSHTTASDGNSTLKEMTEAHYDSGFDIVAVTDHALTDYGWTSQQVNPVMKVMIKLFKGRGGEMEALSADGGTAANGNAYSLVTRAGGDYYYQTDASGNNGQEMLRVPFGIEHNAASLNNAHVNSWFVDYGNRLLQGTSDYITPISSVDALGGLSVINHPGEYTSARDEVYSEDAYNYDNLKYKYQINKFASLLTDYNSCIGIDINSKGDSRTRFDRKLWDTLLGMVVPTGRNVFAIATSDSHGVGNVYSGYTMMCMESNTVENLRESLEKGAYFAASKNIGNYDEIKEIADLLSAGTGEAKAMGDSLTELYKVIETELSDGEQDSKFNAPLDVDAPVVTGVAVDEANDSITLSTTDDALLVRWIADGKLIATGNSIDLDDFSDKIGSYVRAEIFGKGGIVYTQAFTLEYDGAPEAPEFFFVDLWRLADFIPTTLIKLLTALPIFDILWDLIK